jgi:uncharacterized coiled-coil protein SlyX
VADSFFTLLLEKVLPPVVSGGGGVLLAVWRLTKTLGDRVKVLEDVWKHFSEEHYPLDKGGLISSVGTLRADMEKALSDIHTDDRRSMRERLDARRLQASIVERINKMESRISSCEKAVTELNTSFQTFAKEQNEQWQSISKNLGQIEGYLKGVAAKSSGSSGPFPQLK